VTDSVPEPRLWTSDGFRDDSWRHAETLGDAGANDRVILPLTAFLALDDHARAAAAGRLGVLLLPAEPVSAVEPFLKDLALVALAFPSFSDGRSYSKAEILRRAGFDGALRATGDVLIDQIPHMLRTGFDEFEVKHPTALARLAEGRVGGIVQQYQPASAPSAGGEAYSWRRHRA
jgi:uncharacterized protein (DUF934 family)